MTKVLYPGSFDPITKGHMNIIDEASSLFREVVVAVLNNSSKKNNMFTIPERVEMITQALAVHFRPIQRPENTTSHFVEKSC